MELFEGSLSHHDIALRLRKRKTFFQTELRNREKLIQIICFTLLFPMNIFLKSLGLQIHKVELKKHEIGEPTISRNEFRKKLIIQDSFATIDIPDYVCQEATDTANMSERKYNKFRKIVNKLGGRMASMYSKNLLKSQMDDFYTILPNSLGFYVKPIEKVNYVLTKIYQKLIKKINNHTFDLLISGDGFQLTRTHTNAVNFTFKVLNENDSTALYTLGN